ncbi:MAG: GNAT family N-acetyltransferase [Salibacteraceae bacterium]
MSRIFIYKWTNKDKLSLDIDKDQSNQMDFWEPKLPFTKPSTLPRKYYAWWFMKLLGFFGSNLLGVLTFKKNDQVIHYFSVIPHYYKWPFMQRNDIQITYVITPKKHRGKGYAAQCISKFLNQFNQSGDVWYVTDEENIASQKLAEKIGFKFEGYGVKSTKFFGLIKKLNLTR